MRYKLYAPFMRLIHRYGFHYAPPRPMPEPYEPKVGLNGQYENERCHWCQWCGLRGITMAINPKEEIDT